MSNVITPDRVYVGDTYSVKYEALAPSTVNAYQKTPIDVQSAEVRLFDVQEQTFVPIGGEGAEAAQAEVTGNEIAYTVPASALATAGDYKLFTTATFADGRVKTDMRKLKVLEMQ